MKEVKEIKVVCKTSDYLDFEDLLPFQGQFKVRTRLDIEQQAQSILDYGFAFPFFVWSHNGEYLILDGHSRYLALDYLRLLGYVIPKLPVVIVEAENEQDAKLKIIELNNLNGTFSKDVLLEYAKGLSLDFSSLHISNLDFSDIQANFNPELNPSLAKRVVSDTDVENAEYKLSEFRPREDTKDYRDVTCPSCGLSFSVPVYED